MRKVKLAPLSMALFFLILLAGCAATGPEPAKQEGPAEQVRRDVLYTCNCGPQCHCNTVSTKPGTCVCGASLKWGHVLKVEGSEAILCMCDEGCRCSIDPKDPSKCGCGKPVKRVELKESGIYFCNCGGSCYCNTVADEPGPCRCGMRLKKMD